MKEWQITAIRMYFGNKKKINEIAETTGRTRQTVSTFLKSLPEWDEEQQRRRQASKAARVTYKRLWDFHNRSQSDISASVRRDHAQAVAELSKEKYR